MFTNQFHKTEIEMRRRWTANSRFVTKKVSEAQWKTGFAVDADRLSLILSEFEASARTEVINGYLVMNSYELLRSIPDIVEKLRVIHNDSWKIHTKSVAETPRLRQFMMDAVKIAMDSQFMKTHIQETKAWLKELARDLMEYYRVEHHHEARCATYTNAAYIKEYGA